jgi:hypothetical protein
MFDIITHRLFLLGASSVCVHRDSVFCVCTLGFFFTPYVWRALYLEVHLYLEGHICLAGHIYSETYICLEDSSLV